MSDTKTEPPQIATAGVLAGLSHALDITEGHPQGHAERSCAIGLRLAELIELPAPQRAELVYAMLLKDAGCSSNAARVYELFGGIDHEVKRAVWKRNWRRLTDQALYALQWTERGGSLVARFRRMASLALVGPKGGRELFQIRCTRGAEIARKVGLTDGVAQAIHDMDEHWDGGGYPRGLRGEQIPLIAQLIGLAQVMEIFWSEGGPDAALAVAIDRSGSWFDPALVRAARGLREDAVWPGLNDPALGAKLAAQVPSAWALPLTTAAIDNIAEAFALIIDGKSPFTYDHSRHVADYAFRLGQRLDLGAGALTRLRRAALVHDLGKLSVPNSILDKPTALTRAEWEVVRRHPEYTFDILTGVPALAELALDAASHHERIDGKGYHRGVSGDDLSLTARILVVADVMDALAATRPYRDAMPSDRVLQVLHQGRGTQFCQECVEVCSTDVIEERA